MLGQTFPWIILVTPMFILFAKLGFLNNHISMIFCYVSVSLPFAIYLLVGYLESVPRELDEAALIDGCPQFQIIWKIIFPIMIPGIVVTATYSFLLMWSEYLFALAFLTKTNLKTMPLELYAFFGEHTTQWGQVMAASALTTIPTLLLFLPLQKFISEGLTADFMIVDMKNSKPIDLDNLHSKANWTPFEDWPAIFPSKVYRRGELIADHGEITNITNGRNLFS